MTLQINTSTGARDLTTNEQAEARTGLGAAAAADLSAHSSSTSNPHSVTKAQVGLGSVDNTADADKPVSVAQATAIGAAVTAHIDATDPHPGKYAAADHTHTPASIGAATAAQGATADAALQPGPQLTQAAVTAATAPGVALLGAATAAGQRTALGLGTAATTAASDYATAAQGGKADAALVASADAIADVLEAAATGFPTDLARIQSSVSGVGIVAGFDALLAISSPTAGMRFRVAAPVIPGGIPYTQWIHDGSLWRLDGMQDLLADFTPAVGVTGTAEQFLKSWLLPAGLLASLRYVSIYAVFIKSGTIDAVTLCRLRVGSTGSASDTVVGASSGFTAANRQFPLDFQAEFPAATTWRQIGSGTNGRAVGVATTSPYPSNVTIPSTAGALYASLTMQMAGTTDVPTVARAIVSGG